MERFLAPLCLKYEGKCSSEPPSHGHTPSLSYPIVGGHISTPVTSVRCDEVVKIPENKSKGHGS